MSLETTLASVGQLLLFLCGFGVIVGIGMYIYYKIHDILYPPVDIYFLPKESLFSLRRGKDVILFENLTYFSNSSAAYDLGISALSNVRPDDWDHYIGLDRGKSAVAFVRIFEKSGSYGCTLHMPGVDKPEWMKIQTFEKRQHEILAENKAKKK